MQPIEEQIAELERQQQELDDELVVIDEEIGDIDHDLRAAHDEVDRLTADLIDAQARRTDISQRAEAIETEVENLKRWVEEHQLELPLDDAAPA